MKSIVYSYKHGFSGFAAMLTESQAEELASKHHTRNGIGTLVLRAPAMIIYRLSTRDPSQHIFLLERD